jgi:hypothetical protein
MNQIINISRGKVVGIGNVKIPRTREINYEIPMLSFLVIKEENNDRFVSTCVQFQLSGYGTTDETSIEDMKKEVNYFLKTNFTQLSIDDAWVKLKNLCHVNNNEELWNAYYDVKFNLSSEGISTNGKGFWKYPMDMNDNRIKIQKDITYFIEHQEEIVKDHIGEYVAIKNTEILGYFDGITDVFDFTKDKKFDILFVERCQEVGSEFRPLLSHP